VQFTPGDSITIQEVLATSPNFGVGDTVVVRGTYTLRSRESAFIQIQLTSSESGPPYSPPRKDITAGSGTYELEYVIQQAGSLHVTFYPAPGSSNGSSFGGVYFAPPGSGSTTPTTPTTPPASSRPPIDTTGVVTVPFATSQVQFVAGDSITIQEVLATSPRMEPGDVVLVRGQYNLQSRAEATIMVSLTVNVPGLKETVAPNSRKTIGAGAGTFELAYEITQPGSLHVTFYGTGAVSNPSFGGVYFAPPGGSTFNSAAVAISNPAANTGTFGNLAVRSQVSTGGTLIAGITVTEKERYVLIRGVGPSLGAFGVTGTLRKPVLTVYDAKGDVVATGGAWGAAFTGDRRTGIEMLSRSVGAFPLTAGSDDAVLNLRLTPGSYTVGLSTGDGQAGTGLLEVYASATYTLPQ
jgi:hypothetical protein